ncbi:MAG: type II CAAX endopeptidase family protein [Acidobacteriota bacterium]
MIQNNVSAAVADSAVEPPVFTPTPNNPPWNTAFAVGMWLVSVFLIFLIPSLAIIPYILTQHVDVTNSEAARSFLLSDPVAVLIQIGSVIPAHIITLVLAWCLITKLGKYSFAQTLGWRLGGMLWWHFVLTVIGIFGIAGVISYFLPEQENDLTRILSSSRAAVLLVAFLATFSAPFVEEIVYRGVLYSAVQRSAGYYPAIVIVTAAFASVHFVQYWGSPGSLIVITILSLILTLTRAWTNNLLPCITLHFIFNGLQSLLLVLEPYISKPAGDAPNTASMIWRLF